ncbi:hypothetical protein B0H63DRAFT_528990 [Podospora didyma]|uniref:Uncharacterized protein n=1 Tax=Podospora didyma TaxID=330526 RepID=A0AAE0K200_9PEZI|nr:hypothetical protein B0H63DRAFT_528990 [Podospora didyma]
MPSTPSTTPQSCYSTNSSTTGRHGSAGSSKNSMPAWVAAAIASENKLDQPWKRQLGPDHENDDPNFAQGSDPVPFYDDKIKTLLLCSSHQPSWTPPSQSTLIVFRPAAARPRFALLEQSSSSAFPEVRLVFPAGHSPFPTSERTMAKDDEKRFSALFPGTMIIVIMPY